MRPERGHRVGNPLFRTKSIERILADSDAPEHRLKRTLTAWDLTGLGIGAIIGTGIFVLIGTAIVGDDPPAWSRAGNHVVLHSLGSHLRTRCPLLCGICRHDSCRRQRLYLFLCDPGRISGLAHRLEPYSGIWRRLRGSGHRMVRIL